MAFQGNLTGNWKFSSGNVISFTRLSDNHWEGRYSKVVNSFHKELGFTNGMLSYRNVKYNPKTGRYTCEIHWRYKDKNPEWKKHELTLENDKINVIGVSSGVRVK